MNFKHGESIGYSTRLYRVWRNMRSRCQNKNIEAYKWYGAIGIKVCKQWETYEVFAKWARANGYSENLQLDRKNTYGDYKPSNCRFVTALVNSSNKRIPENFKYGTRKKRNKFSSQIRINGKIVHLGNFGSFNEAKNAYIRASNRRAEQYRFIERRGK